MSTSSKPSEPSSGGGDPSPPVEAPVPDAPPPEKATESASGKSRERRKDDQAHFVASRVKAETSGALARTRVDFSDHPSFHATVARAALGGAAGAIASLLFAELFGLSDPSGFFTVMVAAGSLATVAASGKKRLRTLLGAAFGALGGLTYVVSAQAWSAPFASLLLGAAAAPVLAPGESKGRLAITALFAAVFGWAGIHVSLWMQASGVFAGLMPAPLATAIAGSAMGLFFGLASAPKHIARPSDPVEGAYLEALALQDGELHEILARALTIHRSVRTDLAQKKDEPTVIRLGQRVGDLAMRILHIAEQCRRIERDLDSLPAHDLEDRIRSLTQRAESASDSAARDTFLAAATTLDGQRRAFDTIQRGRERVVARLHANIALLEKVRFSLLHLRSADAERFGGEVSPLAEALEELSREIDATSTAVGEVFGRTSEHRDLIAIPPSAGRSDGESLSTREIPPPSEG